MITEFKLNENETKAAEAFEEKHKECSKKRQSTIGGHITYKFTPTSIGDGVVVKCNLCGESENITDYDCW